MESNLADFEFIYTVYGLGVFSEMELPELAPAPRTHAMACPGHVEIRRGRVPEHLEDARRIDGLLEYRSRTCHYDFEGAARYIIEDGCRITIDPHEGAGPNDIRAYLFGSVFGTLLHQRRLLPLHVSAVATPRGLVAFTGDSGAGKSTLAGMLHRHTGWPMFCDDVAVLRQEDKEPLLYAGMLRLKLWKDAVAIIEADPDQLTRDVARYDKFHLHAPEMFENRPLPLVTLIELHRGDKVSLQPVTGFQAFELVTRTIYRPYLIRLFSDIGGVTKKCADVASQLNIYRLARPWSVDGLRDSIGEIAEGFAG